MLRVVLVLEFDRQCLWRNAFLNPVNKCLECGCRLAPATSGTVSQTWHFEIAEEVVDVWNCIPDAVVIVFSAFGRDESVGLVCMSVTTIINCEGMNILTSP